MKKAFLLIILFTLISCESSQRKRDHIFIEIRFEDGRKETIQYLAVIKKEIGDDDWFVEYSWLYDGCIMGFDKLSVCGVRSYEIVTQYKQR